MRTDSMNYLCCPVCNSSFKLSIAEVIDGEVIRGVLDCHQCKSRYEIIDGLPNILYPEKLEPSDMHEQMSYDARPHIYDLRMRWLGLKLGILQAAFLQARSRKMLVDKLGLGKNDSVLETGTGTGIALPSIAAQIGNGGQLHASDISTGMLRVAQKKMKRKGIRAELLQANASYLPYRSSIFNAILHIGGWNTFADKRRAMEEMYRVAKPRAKILICDEGLAPGKEKSWIGRNVLKGADRELYAMKPPKELVPDRAENVQIYWVWNNMYWVVQFRKN